MWVIEKAKAVLFGLVFLMVFGTCLRNSIVIFIIYVILGQRQLQGVRSL